MRDLISSRMCVLALTFVPALGCSSTDGGGSAGSGGSAGAGGSAGDGGSGGDAGAGGNGGSGGSGAISPCSGVWMGEETGGNGSLPICFIVNEAGTQISANVIDCQSFAIQVGITGCGSLWTKNDVQIEQGSFEVIDGSNTITGTFDSARMASGTFAECAMACGGNWTATPAMP